MSGNLTSELQMSELFPCLCPTPAIELPILAGKKRLFAIIHKRAVGQRLNFFPLLPIRSMLPETLKVQVAVYMW